MNVIETRQRALGILEELKKSGLVTYRIQGEITTEGAVTVEWRWTGKMCGCQCLQTLSPAAQIAWCLLRERMPAQLPHASARAT